MKRFGPLLTLLVVVALGAVLFIANSAGNPANRTAAPAAAASAPTSAAVAPAAPPTEAAPAAAAPAVAEKAYAGRSSGNEVTVAIAVKDGRAVAYVCDGKKIESWLEGTVTGSDVSLKSTDGKATIKGTVDDAASFGDVSVDGKSWPYAAKAAVAPAGLYQGRADVRGVVNKVGWIVLNDGSQTGLRDVAGATAPAPVLDPTNLGGVTIDGVPVMVATVTGGTQVWQ